MAGIQICRNEKINDQLMIKLKEHKRKSCVKLLCEAKSVRILTKRSSPSTTAPFENYYIPQFNPRLNGHNGRFVYLKKKLTHHLFTTFIIIANHSLLLNQWKGIDESISPSIRRGNKEKIS